MLVENVQVGIVVVDTDPVPSALAATRGLCHFGSVRTCYTTIAGRRDRPLETGVFVARNRRTNLFAALPPVPAGEFNVPPQRDEQTRAPVETAVIKGSTSRVRTPGTFATLSHHQYLQVTHVCVGGARFD